MDENYIFTLGFSDPEVRARAQPTDKFSHLSQELFEDAFVVALVGGDGKLKAETRNQKSESTNQKLEIGKRRSKNHLHHE
jgi:hypothetical protein